MLIRKRDGVVGDTQAARILRAPVAPRPSQRQGRKRVAILVYGYTFQ